MVSILAPRDDTVKARILKFSGKPTLSDFNGILGQNERIVNDTNGFNSC